jgi:hypothetical protein
MAKAPLSQMKETFGDKEKLVDAISGLIELGSETKDQAKARLLAVSNTKLMHLHAVAKEVKDKFGGSKDKLLDALVGKLGRAKDGDFKKGLTKYTTARLLDMYRVAERKAKGAAKGATAKAGAAAGKTKAAAKKTVAKATGAAAKAGAKVKKAATKTKK